MEGGGRGATCLGSVEQWRRQGGAPGAGAPPRWVEKIFNRQITHFWAQYLHYMDFFLSFPQKFLARSIAFYIISVPYVRRLGMQRDSLIIFSIFSVFLSLIVSFQSALKHMQNCTKIVCGWEFARPFIWLRKWDQMHPQCVVGRDSLPRTRWGSLQRSPRSTVVEDSSKQTQFFVRFGVTRTTLGGLLYTSCCKFRKIGRERKSVKNYENWFTLLKVIAIQRMTFLLDILYFLLSNPALTPLQKRSFQLAKMPKNTRFLLWFLKNFLGA